MSKHKTKVQFNIENFDFSRIAVIGCPGSGKTTFAKELGKSLSRSVVHLDKFLWNPKWEVLPYEKRSEIHGQLIADDEWIIDGMWRSHLEERFARATLVIFLDYKRRICLSRAIKRRIKFSGRQRDDIAEGCLEKLDWSFLRYILRFRRKVRPQILDLAQKYIGSAFMVTLSSPNEAEDFLSILKNTNGFV